MNQLDIVRDSALLSQEKTLQKLFELTCAHGDLTAAMWLEGEKQCSVTYARYRQMTDDYSAYLQQSLPDDGGYVAICMDTCMQWFPTFWGVIRSGHRALLLDASMSDALASHLMGEAGCRAIITPRKRRLDGEPLQILTDELFAAPPVEGFSPQKCGDAVALCTSGTTGTSRVFVYDGKALCEQVLASRLVYEQNSRLIDNVNRRSLAFLPFHHVLGFVAVLLWCSFLGYGTVYLKDRTPKTILATCQAFQPNLVVTVPLLANNLCVALRKKVAKEPPVKRGLFHVMLGISLMIQRIAPGAGLRLAEKHLFKNILNQLLGTKLDSLVLGGSHTPSENLRLLNGLGYYTVCGFGMTETAVTSFETSMNLKKRVSGSVGKPLSSMEYRTRDGGSEGEMLVKSAAMHTGRLAGGQLLPPATENGWYPTGDIVRIDPEGRVFVEGRCKDVIIGESGENIYPDELEDVFAALPGVQQMTVLGVKKQEDSPYEQITLVMNAGEALTDQTQMEALRQAILRANQTLPATKQLSRALVTAEPLPLVSGIKVKRLELKRQLESGEKAYQELALRGDEPLIPQPVTAKSQEMDDIRNRLRHIYAEALDMEERAVGDNAHFVEELGGDSLQMLSIALKVEEAFGVLIDTEDYGRCATISGLAGLMQEKLGGGEKVNQAVVMENRKPITRFEDTPEYQAFARRMDSLLASGEGNPYFVCHDSPLLDKSLMAGQEVLNFGSYNYVGMSGRKEVKEAAKAAIDLYGTSASGSRLLAGEKSLHGQLEREIADWKHTESALVCVGGHSTNVTFVGNFCGKNDLILYDALAHNSIEQGCRLSQALSKPFPHNDAAALESILRTQRSHFEKVLIVIEGAYSMDGDIADVPAFVRLKKQYGCFLMVDEAHSACVIGKTGGGVDEYFGLEPEDIDIKMGTLSKGLGTCGGYLAGKKCLIEYLRYSLPGFVFSVGISPALAAGTLESIRLLRNDPSIMKRMACNIKCFAQEARKRRLDICLAGETAILPVLVGRDEDAFLLSNELRRRGVFVPPAVYPAVPRNKARLRFCVISEHEPEQIITALDTLEAAARDLHIELPRRNYDEC